MWRNIFLLTVFIPGMLSAGTVGKIKGRIIDQETGLGLADANIVIVDTRFGAASDDNGDFVILNLPAGTYILGASHIGYRDVTLENVQVNVDLTTTTNFALPVTTIELAGIVMIAERPLVNSNATNYVAITTAEEIENLPIRNYHTIVSLSAGSVINNDGEIYIRGGRLEETAYYIDGVYQNNLRFGDRSVAGLSPNSLEEVSVQVGGFNAEYGFANSGVINVTTKTGGSRFNIFAEAISDDWLSRSRKTLGTYAYGYNVANLALSGPVPGLASRIRFFGSLEHNFLYDRRPSAGVHPVLIEDRDAPDLGLAGPEDIDVVEARSGPLPNNDLARWLFNGNINIDLRPVQIKIGGNSTRERYDDALAKGGRNILHNFGRHPRIREFAQSLYFKVTHAFSRNSFYTGQMNFFMDGDELFDPVLKRDIVNYGDKSDLNDDGIFNPDLFQDGDQNDDDASTANLFHPSGFVYDRYGQNRSSYVGGRFDLTHQQGKHHELKAGFEFRYHTLKRYRMVYAVPLAAILSTVQSSDPAAPYIGALTDAYGFNLIQDPGPDGDLRDDDLSEFDGAKHPVIWAAYLQDKIEISDLVLNLGIRFDYFDANANTVADPLNIIIANDGRLDRSQLRRSKTHTTISPRLGMAFPISESSVFYGQYGKFTQQPPLRHLYTGWEFVATQLAQNQRFFFANPDLKPVKTTSYEVGFRQQVGTHAALNIAAYYKETRDLIQLENVVNAQPAAYTRYTNGDYGTIRGLSINFNLRRTSRVAANLSYTLQFAGGTGSTGVSNDWFWYLRGDGPGGWPAYVSATEFDQRHTGSMNVDILFDRDDGPSIAGFKPLARTDLNFLFTYGSGFPYTPFINQPGRDVPSGAINSVYGPWQFQVDMKISRSLTFGKLDFDIFLWAINVLNIKNWDTQAIYGRTGSNSDTGFLDRPDGQRWIEENGGEPAAELYRLSVNQPARWSVPRQLRLGFRIKITP